MGEIQDLEAAIEEEIQAIKRRKNIIRSVSAVAGLLAGGFVYYGAEKMHIERPDIFTKQIAPLFLPPEIKTYALGISHGAAAYIAVEGLISFVRSAGAATKIQFAKKGTPQYNSLVRELAEKTTDPITQCIYGLNMDMVEGKVDRALEKYAQFLRVTARYRPNGFVLQTIAGWITDGLNRCLFAIRGKKTVDLSTTLDLAFSRLATHKSSVGRWYFEKACEIEGKEQPEINCLYAMALDVMEKPEEAQQQWRRTIDLVLNQPDAQFRRLGESRNEVLEISRRFFTDKVVFKRGSDNVRKDFVVNRAIHDAWQKNSPETEERLVRSLCLIDHKGYDYHISKRKPVRNIEQRLADAEDVGVCVLNMLDTEARVHALTPLVVSDRVTITTAGMIVNLPVYDHRKKLTQRLIDRCGHNAESEGLFAAYEGMTKKVGRRVLYVIHGDATLANGLEDGTLLDFEAASLGMPTIDLATTLEDVGLEGIDRTKARQRYIDALEESQGKQVDHQMFARWYEWDAAHQAICQVGSQLHLGRPNQAQAYARQALERTKQIDKQLHERLRGYFGTIGALADVVG